MIPLLVRALLLIMLAGHAAAADITEQPPRTQVDVAYGPHPRNVLDFWKASGEGPRPLLVYIHGGGWITGDKSQKMPVLQPFLDRGISCAAINYRLAPDHPLPAPVHDAARAVQFLRSKAADWNIRTDRIALTGPSAGGCTAMWLLLHDDLADPDAADLVARESTRVWAAAAEVGQTSIDPKILQEWLGPAVLQHAMIFMAVGERSMEAALQNYESHRAVYFEFSPLNHLDRNDPPLFLTGSAETDLPSRSAGHGIHHPLHGIKLKEASDRAGHECHLLVPGYAVSKHHANAQEFLVAKLLAK